MANDIFGILRTVGLIVMIVCAVLCEAILIFASITQGLPWFWAIYWGVGVIIGVIVAEIWAYAKTGKTISTQWRDWAKEKPGWAYGALALMATAFAGLIVHLAVWGGMAKKKDE